MSRCASVLIIGLLIIFLIFQACHKKNYPLAAIIPPKSSPRIELLTSYIWKEKAVQLYKFIGSDTLVYNLTKQFEHIDKDDLTLFREDGTFLFEEGQTKFTPQSAQKYATGTWQLMNNEATLTLKTLHSSDAYQIIELDTSTLVLRLTISKEQQKYAYLITYVPVSKSPFGEEKARLAASTVYTEVDQQPQYPGGMQALSSLLRKTQKYPKEATKKGIEGKVVVQFVINPEGVPGQFEVIESLGYGCDEAVLQTCQKMSKWQPGILHGKPVPVQITLPVVFKL